MFVLSYLQEVNGLTVVYTGRVMVLLLLEDYIVMEERIIYWSVIEIYLLLLMEIVIIAMI